MGLLVRLIQMFFLANMERVKYGRSSKSVVQREERRISLGARVCESAI